MRILPPNQFDKMISAYLMNSLRLGSWAHLNMMEGLSASSLALFTRDVDSGGLGWCKEELEVFLAKVRKDIANTNIHAYCWM